MQATNETPSQRDARERERNARAKEHANLTVNFNSLASSMPENLTLEQDPGNPETWFIKATRYNGDVVTTGDVRVSRNGYYSRYTANLNLSFRLSSPKIPNRYGVPSPHAWNARTFKNLSSVAERIAEFCKPDSEADDLVSVIDERATRYRNRRELVRDRVEKVTSESTFDGSIYYRSVTVTELLNAAERGDNSLAEKLLRKRRVAERMVEFLDRLVEDCYDERRQVRELCEERV